MRSACSVTPGMIAKYTHQPVHATATATMIANAVSRSSPAALAAPPAATSTSPSEMMMNSECRSAKCSGTMCHSPPAARNAPMMLNAAATIHTTICGVSCRNPPTNTTTGATAASDA